MNAQYKEVIVSDNYLDAYEQIDFDPANISEEQLKKLKLNQFYLRVNDEKPIVYRCEEKVPSRKKFLKLYSDKILDFRDEIYAKCVLNGNTPLFVSADEFKYGYNQTYIQKAYDVNYITSDTQLTFTNKDNKDSTSTLLENENIIFRAPSYIKDGDKQFGNNVIYQRVLTSEISANSIRALTKDELVVFYYRSTSDEPYQYDLFVGAG